MFHVKGLFLGNGGCGRKLFQPLLIAGTAPVFKYARAGYCGVCVDQGDEL